MKEILFDSQTGTLIDKRGNPYEGKIFRSCTLSSDNSYSTPDQARQRAIDRAIAVGNKKAAEAYCLRDIVVEEQKDPQRFTARATIDLYIH